MLSLLLGLLVGAGPLLRGSWDLWAQALLFLAVTAGFGAWLIARLLVGYLPLPSNRLLLWTAGLAAASFLSAASSPLASYAVPSWRGLVLGLWIFPILAAVSKDQRAAIDEAVRVSAWALMLLAFYQHYHDKLDRPPSALLNQNVFAGTVLLLLPLAVQKRDWFLSAGLLMTLLWAHSVGAWLGLSGALILTRRNTGPVAYWAGAAIGFVCLVAIYGKLQSPDVVHRWQWWVAAWRMAWARPWLGFGPGTFAYVMPAYQAPGGDLSALYAHEHFLETAAECGFPYTLAWCLGLVHCLRRKGSHKRFGALAILIQSLWDYSLSIPANFWLLCYFTASSESESSCGVNVPGRLKLPCCVLVVLAAGAAGRWTWRRWDADRLKASAVERFREGAPVAEVLSLLERSSSLAADPEAERFAAEAELSRARAGGLSREAALSAVGHLERAASLNPYRPSTWAALERIYRALGDKPAAERARLSGARFAPALRP